MSILKDAVKNVLLSRKKKEYLSRLKELSDSYDRFAKEQEEIKKKAEKEAAKKEKAKKKSKNIKKKVDGKEIKSIVGSNLHLDRI